jgi:class 3 adenylate cyclase
MSTPNTADLTVKIKLLEQRLKIVHTVDEINDQFEQEGLRDLLLEILRFLARELNASSAFVSYYDGYHRVENLSVDTKGLIKIEELEVVDKLRSHVEDSEEPFRSDVRIFKGNYYALPLIIDEQFLGILGIGKCEPGDDGCLSEVTREDEIFLSDAARVLDTAIRKQRERQISNDELYLTEDMDRIIDEGFFDQSEVLSRLLPALSKRVKTRAALLFGPDMEVLNPIAADDSGQILWVTSQELQLQIKLLLQHHAYHRKLYTKDLTDDSPDNLFAGRPIRCIVVQPLRTNAGQVAGTLVLLSDEKMSDGHKRMIKRAASILDTVILAGRHTEVMVKRYTKYVGTETLKVLLDSPTWLEPRQEQIVILSADLVGSTDYAHTESNALAVFQHINQYLALIGQIVKNRFHGTLDKYIGDEVMAIFGAPVPDARKAANGIECALCVLRELESFNRKRKEQEEPVFQVKITLGLVRCVVGEIGAKDTQSDYTAIGQEVNQVFRIATHAEADRIIVNEALFQELNRQYEFELVERTAFKGVPEKLAIYRLEHGKS